MTNSTRANGPAGDKGDDRLSGLGGGGGGRKWQRQTLEMAGSEGDRGSGVGQGKELACNGK